MALANSWRNQSCLMNGSIAIHQIFGGLSAIRSIPNLKNQRTNRILYIPVDQFIPPLKIMRSNQQRTVQSFFGFFIVSSRIGIYKRSNLVWILEKMSSDVALRNGCDPKVSWHQAGRYVLMHLFTSPILRQKPWTQSSSNLHGCLKSSGLQAWEDSGLPLDTNGSKPWTPVFINKFLLGLPCPKLTAYFHPGVQYWHH